MALHLWQLLHRRLRLLQQAGNIHACALQQCLVAVVLAQHGNEDMARLYEGMVVRQGERLRLAQGFLKFGREFVDAHEEVSGLLPTLGARSGFSRPGGLD